VFPDGSVAVQVTVVVPNGNKAGALFVIVTEQLSVSTGEVNKTEAVDV